MLHTKRWRNFWKAGLAEKSSAKFYAVARRRAAELLNRACICRRVGEKGSGGEQREMFVADRRHHESLPGRKSVGRRQYRLASR